MAPRRLYRYDLYSNSRKTNSPQNLLSHPRATSETPWPQAHSIILLPVRKHPLQCSTLSHKFWLNRSRVGATQRMKHPLSQNPWPAVFIADTLTYDSLSADIAWHAISPLHSYERPHSSASSLGYEGGSKTWDKITRRHKERRRLDSMQGYECTCSPRRTTAVFADVILAATLVSAGVEIEE